MERELIFGFSDSKLKYPIFSWLIKLVYGWDSSHVYVEFENRKFPGNQLIYQASKSMTNFMLKSTFLESNEINHQFKIKVSPAVYDLALLKCMQLSGKSYGKWQALGMGLAKILRLKKNPFSEHQKFVCSEIVFVILNEIGHRPAYDMELVSPKDIYTFLKQGEHV